MKRHRSESGQTLVLLTLALAGLLGFSALALDGGMLYSERRRAQNAADSAAMAAALAKIKGANWASSALNRAASNGFSNTVEPCSPAGYDCALGVGPKWTTEVSHPPRSGQFAGNNAYIQVVLTTEVSSSFAHLVFAGPLQTTVEAVVRIWPPQGISPGYAMHATSEHDCKGIWFSGTGDTIINGGSVFSNSDAGSGSCQSGVQDGNGNITVGPPPENIQVVGTFDDSGSGSVSPAPVQGVPHQDLRPYFLPDCSGLPDFGVVKINDGESSTLPPGRYESISFGANSMVTLDPGMYCIYGKGGIKGLSKSITGVGVMIYMQDGDFDLAGSLTVDLAAEQNQGVLVDPSGHDWKGMLIYVDPSNNSPVQITGSSGSIYTGTVFAPSSLCTINGTGDSLGLNSQLICNKVKITGTAKVEINYQEDQNYYLPPAIDLAK